MHLLNRRVVWTYYRWGEFQVIDSHRTLTVIQNGLHVDSYHFKSSKWSFSPLNLVILDTMNNVYILFAISLAINFILYQIYFWLTSIVKKSIHERLKFDNDPRLINLDRFLYYSFAHVTSIQEVGMVRNSKIINVCFSYGLQCIIERSSLLCSIHI